MADPRYTVTVIFSIGEYIGEWTGKEERMEEQYRVLCNSPSKAYAELFFKNLVGENSPSAKEKSNEF